MQCALRRLCSGSLHSEPVSGFGFLANTQGFGFRVSCKFANFGLRLSCKFSRFRCSGSLHIRKYAIRKMWGGAEIEGAP